MLHLQSETSPRWFDQVDQHLDQILIDHAHCERKAASTAMTLINAYALDRELCRQMTEIVAEELDHYAMVLRLLDERSIKFVRLPSGPYGKELGGLIRSPEPQRAVDRLLIASLIEARSCERFCMLAEHVRYRDAVLADFYAGLFASEARHHTTYVKLAENYAPRKEVFLRLDELSSLESKIISVGSPLPRMHS